jgi:CheY-like chemotaxis protein
MSDHRLPRVLVVDDEEPVRGLLCDLLAAWGCRAVEAANGAQALTLFDEGDWDLVLTDYTMPGRTGLELIRDVRDRDATIGVIMLTASAIDLERESERLEFTLLQKPLQLDGLKTAVSQGLLRRSRGTPAALR